MINLPPYLDATGNTGVETDRGATYSTPRWVKVFVITFIALILLFVILHLTGNSLGGPMGHTMRVEQWLQQLWP